MIVVSGEPRSGTSLMMTIMDALGFKIGGEQWVSTQEDRSFMNPKGFWEIQWLVYQGLQEYMLDHSLPAPNPDTEVRIDPSIEVVKISTLGLLKSNYRLLDKIILCIRDPREVAVSSRNQKKWVSDKLSFESYATNCARLLTVFKPQAWIDMIAIVDYGKLMTNPEVELEYLCRFLGKVPTQAAFDKIDTSLYRSKRNQVKKHKLAQKYYDTLFQTMINQRTYW